MTIRNRLIPLAVVCVASIVCIVCIGGVGVAAPMSAGASPDLAAGRAPDATAQVTIVHGLRGELVDVYVDGAKLLDGFQPDRLTDPLSLPVGAHHVELRTAGSPSTSAPKASADPVLTAGPAAIVAHFAPDGSWTMSVFDNDVGTLAAGVGRVVFRNTAGVSPVDVRLTGGQPVDPLSTGQEAGQDVRAASYAVQVGAADGTALVPDDDIAVDPGAELVLYLVGRGDNVTWLSQRVAATAAAPVTVKAGNSGLLDSGGSPGRDSSDPLGRSGLAAGVVLVALGSLSMRRRTVRARP